MTLFSEQITLLGQKVITDDLGNQETVPTEVDVFCSIKDMGSNAYYKAASAGLKPSFIATVHTFEYHGERKVKYEGQTYNVIRPYRVDHHETELTCEKVK